MISTNGYTEAVEKLLSLADFERKSRANQPPDWHLRRVERLMEMLGNPCLAKPVIHVAGSKGKGSTAAMISAALSANGYKTGLFTSPHLHSFVERIRVDGTPISKSGFADAVDTLWPFAEEIEQSGDLGMVSVFEMLTAMAFAHFRDTSKVDIAVIEVGLGGRLDATNVVDPLVSVITPISLDHVPILGNTVPEIAAEKAGIIKPGRPTVVGPQVEGAHRVFESVAHRKGSQIVDVRSASRCDSVRLGMNGKHAQAFKLHSDIGDLEIETPLLGAHQIDNARTAVAALSALADQGFDIDPQCVARGISALRWPCRGEAITDGNGIVLLLDGAHNNASAVALKNALTRHFNVRSGVGIVYGGTSGHDSCAVLKELKELEPTFVITTQSRHPKSIPGKQLADDAATVGVEVDAVVDDVGEAIDAAKILARERGIDLIVACGSLFVAAEARERALGIEPEVYSVPDRTYMPAYSSDRNSAL